jgi:hypothetical protein
MKSIFLREKERGALGQLSYVQKDLSMIEAYPAVA